MGAAPERVSPRRFIELLAIYAKMDLATLMRDTGFMITCIVSDLCANASAISGIFLLAWKFGGIGGLDKFEVLFMLAYCNIVVGSLDSMGGCNALYVSRIIGRGQWEHMFIMPLPFGVQLTVGAFPFTSSSKLVTGIILMCVAVANLSAALPWWWGFALAANLALSMSIMIGVSFLASSLAFYAPVQCEEISSAVVYSASYTATFPLSGMPLYLRAPLLSIFPAGLIAWFPTMLILGKTPALANIYALAFTAVLALAASHTFKKGFRYYMVKGINRYVSGGHRC